MTDDLEVVDRRLSRQDLFKLAAAAGGAGLLAGRTGAASAALERLDRGERAAAGARLGGLRLRRRPVHVRAVRQEVPEEQAEVHRHGERSGRARVSSSRASTADIFRPYVGWVKYFAESGLVQPWDTKLIPNFKHLNPLMVKAGQYKGQQYGIPEDWGFDAILYRSDKVKPKARSWGLLFDERYKGKIAWYDDGSTMLPMTGLYLGFKDPWNQTDAQLKQAQKFLVSKKHLVRTDLVLRDGTLGSLRLG